MVQTNEINYMWMYIALIHCFIQINLSDALSKWELHHKIGHLQVNLYLIITDLPSSYTKQEYFVKLCLYGSIFIPKVS